jgi:TRAP-type C4-dicarboxylate transport system permease small subunit
MRLVAKWIMSGLDEAILRLSLVAFIVLALLQIITRYVMNAPLQWTEEVAVFVLIWMTYIGGWVLLRKNAHVRLEIVESLLPPSAVRIVDLFWNLIILGILCVLIYAGIKFLPIVQSDKTPALQVSYAYVFAIIPLSCAVMALLTVGQILNTFKNGH